MLIGQYKIRIKYIAVVPLLVVTVVTSIMQIIQTYDVLLILVTNNINYYYELVMLATVGQRHTYRSSSIHPVLGCIWLPPQKWVEKITILIIEWLIYLNTTLLWNIKMFHCHVKILHSFLLIILLQWSNAYKHTEQFYMIWPELYQHH